VKVLFVSENKNSCEVLKRIINNLFKDIDFLIAANQEEAINIVSSDGPFGFFIIDVEIKKSDPEETSNILIDLAGQRPFLFLGNDANIVDRIGQNLFQSNPYNEKILKPLDRSDISEDIKIKVTQALKWAKEEDFESTLEDIDPDDFISMKLKSFYLYDIFPYDIYLEITSTQYIKILSANKKYSLSTLSSYAKKNIKVLYIKKDDQLKYLETESMKCLKALKKISIESKDIFVILLRSITILHQYMTVLGVNPTILSLANAITDLTINFSEKSRDLKPLLKSYPNLYEGIASKSLMTALIADKICQKMGWDSITTKKKLAMSALLHDFTLPDDSMSKINYVTDPRLQNYCDAKIDLFYNHPITASKIASQFSMYPDIDYIIEHHHELPQKKGFPAHPPQIKLTAICGVFNTAQYVAAEFDGNKISLDLVYKMLRSMNRDFNSGNFKEPYTIIKKLLGPK
jgi:putative nucleotidyltransferase with HDIG domain